MKRLSLVAALLIPVMFIACTKENKGLAVTGVEGSWEERQQLLFDSSFSTKQVARDSASLPAGVGTVLKFNPDLTFYARLNRAATIDFNSGTFWLSPDATILAFKNATSGKTDSMDISLTSTTLTLIFSQKSATDSSSELRVFSRI
jgi:hypothetical protein